MSDKFTFTQSMTLQYIQEHPYTTLEDISEGLGIKKQFISRALHKFEDENTIKWEQYPEYLQPLHGTHQTAYAGHGWIIAQPITSKVN